MIMVVVVGVMVMEGIVVVVLYMVFVSSYQPPL